MKHTKDDIVAERLKKSEQVMTEAKTLINVAAWTGAINRLYYAAFHAVSVLLYQHDIKHKAHAGAKTMLEFHFVKTGLVAVEWGRFYATLFADRNDSDYEDFTVFTADDVLPLLPQTEEFIAVIKRLITHN